MDYDIVIKGARSIVGQPPHISDIRIAGGIITEVGDDLATSRPRRPTRSCRPTR